MKVGITLLVVTWAFVFIMAFISSQRHSEQGGSPPHEVGSFESSEVAQPQEYSQPQKREQPVPVTSPAVPTVTSAATTEPEETTKPTGGRQLASSSLKKDAHLSIRPNRQEGVSCRRPPTQAVTKATRPDVYRWRDENGRLHLSDVPPPHIDAEVYDNQAPAVLDYFDLDIGYEGLQRVPYLSDRLRPRMNRVYTALTGLVGRDHLRKVVLNLRIFPDRSQYLAYASRYHPDPNQTAGFYTTAGNQAVTYIHSDPDRTLRVAVHEGLHVIAAGMFGAGTVPIWLNEGLAEYFEDIETQAQYALVSVNEAKLRRARSLVARGYPRRLIDLMTMGREDWYSQSEAHYALSWALVFFLLDSEQGRHALSQFLTNKAERYCENLDIRQWLTASYPGGEAGLDRDFRSWLRQASTAMRHRY